MSKSQPEKLIVDVCLKNLRKCYPNSWFEKNVVAFARLQSGQPCSFGLGKGSSDIVGCHMGKGLFFEVKTPTGTQSPEQKAFQERITLAGGFYRLIRCWRDAEAAMKELDNAGVPAKELENEKDSRARCT